MRQVAQGCGLFGVVIILVNCGLRSPTFSVDSSAFHFFEEKRNDLFESILLDSKRVVLVTGAAGFIGFHVAMRLHEEGDTVIGIDNFNHHYDVLLKEERAAQLGRMGANTLIRGDVCDLGLMVDVLRRGRVTNVIHLAAQAGVRHSLTNPLPYVESNIKCFVTLLEAVHTVNKSIPISYASSSSVYGLNKKTPFSEQDVVDAQASLYGATKKSDESIAHVYHHLHGLKLTGLRFFTVYGPCGRPDMAYFEFADSIVKGSEITLFETETGEEMRRDFTYITDIVDGVISSSRLAAPLEIFNLGKGTSEKVSDLVRYIEKGLGRKANVKRAKINAGDVSITHANVTHAKELLHYAPRVSLEDGVYKFLLWYCGRFNVSLPILPTQEDLHDLSRRYNMMNFEF